MNKRDKFLTEEMEECWHEEDKNLYIRNNQRKCRICKEWQTIKTGADFSIVHADFSTWDGFGKLKYYLETIGEIDHFLNWYIAKKRKEFFGVSIPCRVEFYKKCILVLMKTPDRFADATYEWLRREGANEK